MTKPMAGYLGSWRVESGGPPPLYCGGSVGVRGDSFWRTASAYIIL